MKNRVGSLIRTELKRERDRDRERERETDSFVVVVVFFWPRRFEEGD